MSYRTRRLLSLVVLLIGLPAYIIAATYLVGLFDRPPILVESAIYIGLGLAWALPFKAVFKGVGKPDPEAELGETLPDGRHKL